MKRFIENYDGRHYDVVVVGGGITGSAIAYEAANRGLSVALIEKHDFGWATSAATSKMIHGGLRYLYYGEIGLVRESLQERRILENIAPNFVYPLPILLPVYKSRWATKAGLTLYDMIAYDKKWTWDPEKSLPNHRTVPLQEATERIPHIRTEGLESAELYYDCQSAFPERLTLAFVRSAIAQGAHVANYVEAMDPLYTEGGKVVGVRAKDLLTDKEHELFGSVVVNCGGPWADLILKVDQDGECKHTIKRSEGIHFITDKLPADWGAVLWTPDGRHLFVLPWRGHTLVGTTDKEYKGDPDKYRVTAESIQELIDTVNSCYGDGELCLDDIIYAYGGLRPLVECDSEDDTYNTSRKYEIHDNSGDGVEGLITVEGGKYTTSRNLAENAMKVISRKVDKELKKSTTTDKQLSGCEIRKIEDFVREQINLHQDFDADTVEVLARNYGTQCGQVMEIARSEPKYTERVTFDGEILAEVVFAVRHEMARKLTDILLRRTGIGTLGNPGPDTLRKVADIAARELGWSDAQWRAQIDEANAWLNVPR